MFGIGHKLGVGILTGLAAGLGAVTGVGCFLVPSVVLNTTAITVLTGTTHRSSSRVNERNPSTENPL